MQIFLGISWLTYFCYAVVFSAVYYAFVGYKYYREELLQLWEKKISNGRFNDKSDLDQSRNEVNDDDNRGVVDQYMNERQSPVKAKLQEETLSGEDEWTEEESEEFVQELIDRQKEEELTPYSVANLNHRVNGVEH